MAKLKMFDSVHDMNTAEDMIRQRRYGVIVTRNQRFEAIHFRPWPKLVSIGEALWLGGWKHTRGQPDFCQLWFNQPLLHSNYLSLIYIQSTWQTTYATFRRALIILDRIAELKGSDALFCEVTNPRISDRLLRRQGWERHLESSRRRHWIKRFYGRYPKPLASTRAHADRAESSSSVSRP